MAPTLSRTGLTLRPRGAATRLRPSATRPIEWCRHRVRPRWRDGRSTSPSSLSTCRSAGAVREAVRFWRSLASCHLIAGAIVVVFAITYLFFRITPISFLPEEDQGYVFLALQLPDASSLERTDQVCHQIEDFLSKTPGVQYTTSVIGFSLLSLVQNTYSAFFFVTFKPWSERTKPEEQYPAIKARINQYLGSLSEGIAFAFPPPAILVRAS